jgi:aryl-alcohol dehydrogenase-like predicted oxidoreductase
MHPAVPLAMITIPQTDLSVHPLCLGGSVFGWTADSVQSESVLDAYVKHGGNFIDTADVYSEWVEGNKGGESENIIGNWMKARNNRQNLVIASKVFSLSTRPGLSAKNIVAACEDTLGRLGTDYLDLYYAHRDDLETPMEETLIAFTSLISAGKVRYIAASQFSPERLEEALRISSENGLASYIAVQDHYNLMERNEYEVGVAKVVLANGISTLPFRSLARGFLTGKYRPGLIVDSIRAADSLEYQLLQRIALKHNSSMSSVALAWLRAQPSISTPVASARTVQQLEEIVQVIELTTEEIQQLSLRQVNGPQFVADH